MATTCLFAGRREKNTSQTRERRDKALRSNKKSLPEVQKQAAGRSRGHAAMPFVETTTTEPNSSAHTLAGLPGGDSRSLVSEGSVW